MKKTIRKYNFFQIIDKFRYLKLSISPVVLFTGLSHQIDESFLLLHPIYKKVARPQIFLIGVWTLTTLTIHAILFAYSLEKIVFIFFLVMSSIIFIKC